MNIIRASIEDLDLITSLFDLYRQFYSQSSDLMSAKEFLSERIKKNESVIFLAIDEKTNEGMGFVQLYQAFSSVSMKRLWILNDLFVHEDYRMKGVAEALIEKSKELAVQTDSKGLILETHKTNVSAQKLYNKTGFTKDDDYFRYYFP